MKRTLSFILTMFMLFSSIPVSVFAEEITEVVDEVQTEETVEIDESKIGNEVTVGNAMYYIEDGNLLLSVDYARPQTIDTDVFWVVEDGGNVYYAKYDEYITYIYKADEEKALAKLFCPADCFDVDGEDVYYSYQGEIFKLHMNDSKEEVVVTDKILKNFYLSSNGVEIINIDDENESDDTENVSLTSAIVNINDSSVFLKQPKGSKTCTLYSNLMMFRRGALINQNTNWTSFTEDNYRTKWWSGGMAWEPAGEGMKAKTYGKKFRAQYPLGDKDSRLKFFKEKLQEHKEGIVIYVYSSASEHAILLTDYNSQQDVFFCADPAGDKKGRIKLSESTLKKYVNDAGYKKPEDWSDQEYILAYVKQYWQIESGITYCQKCTNIGTKGYKNFEVIGNGTNIHAQCISCKASYSNDSQLDTSYAGTYKRKEKSWNYTNLYFRYAPYDRKNPNTLIQKKQYTNLEILGLVTCADGGKWYKVNIGGQIGYIVAYKVDADFEPVGVSFVEGPEGIKLPPAKTTQKSIPLRGEFKTNNSNIKITKVHGYIKKASDNSVVDEAHVNSVNSSTYKITKNSTINQNLEFNKLSNGTYYIQYDVETDENGTYTFYSYDYPNSDGYRGFFTVGKAPQIALNNIIGGKKVTFTSDSGSKITYYVNNDKKTIASGGSVELKKAGTYNITATDSGGESKVSFTIEKASKPTIWDYMKNAIKNMDVDIDVNYGDKCAYVTIAGEGNVYYTTDGSEPTSNSKKYTEPFPIEESTTIKAISIQSGCAPSDVETKEIVIKEPEPPTISLYNTKSKIAQGKTASVSWEKVKFATSYTASLYLNGELVEEYNTTGNLASFNLSKRSDTENFNYTITVVAENFVGPSKDSNAVSVTAMHPVTVTFVDRITRTGELTESKLQEVKERINEHEKNDRGYNLEGQVLSVQKVDYDSLPSKPAVPSKKGFDFAGWSAELFQPAVTDTTVYADYEIKYYTVKFYDMDNNFNRNSSPISNDKYMYTDAAIPPENYTPSGLGYVLSGWTVDIANSDGTDYKYVDGDMIVDIACGWENPNLPCLLEITKVTRTDGSYNVEIRIKNSNIAIKQARVVAALYTSDGRQVYSQISEENLPIGGYTEWTEIDDINLNYELKASYAKAYLVEVNRDITGGALSEEAVCKNIVLDENSKLFKENSEWTEYSSWSTTPVSAVDDKVKVKTKTQYRYRDKNYTSSASSSLSSEWTKYDTRRTSWGATNGPVYSNPDNGVRNVWSESYVKSSNYKTVYRYYRYANSTCATYGSSYPDYKYYYEWEYDSPLTKVSGTDYSYKLWCSCGISKGYHTVYSVNWQGHGDYPASKWVSYNYGTRWYYQEPIYTYYYWKWGGWSGWSDTQPSSSSDRQIETRPLYSFSKRVSNYDSNTDPEEGAVADYPEIKGVLDCGETEYITEDKLNAGNYSVLSGPFYKNDDGNYVDIENRQATEYRYGRYTNGTYVMPCKELAEELYGGEWQLEYTDWSEREAENINEAIYSCESTEHTHTEASQREGVNYWNEYVVDGKSYCFVESRELTKEITFADTNKYYLVSKDLEGRKATVLAYKKINTDPTQGQLQYANQIEIGRGNTYNFTINPKEMVEYGKTGDFIIALALEGSHKLINVAVIEAEAPKHELCFYVNGKDYIPDCVRNNYEVYVDESDGISKYKDEDGIVRFANTVLVSENESQDVNELGIPELDGYRFIKWDKSLTNITGRMDINAVLEKEDYAVVFVDHENETVDLQELYYGDPISAPDVLPVEGKIFKGWDNQTYRYVLEAEKDNERYNLIDGPYYMMVDGNYIIADEHSGEELVDNTKYYRVLNKELGNVTGSMVITAVWESVVYDVMFCDLEGNTIYEEKVPYGEAATPPACVVIEGVEYPWSTNGKTWWNVTENMTIYPYKYSSSNIVAPVADTASGTYKNGQVVYLETQDNTPIYYTTDVEITLDDIQEYVTNLESKETESLSDTSEDISLLSDEESSNEYEDSDEGFETDGIDVTECISEYTEPIIVNESSIIYAFTVQDGEISPISVYHYEINENVGDTHYDIDPDMAQITMPNITAKPGETVTVPVSIKNNPGVSNLSLVFAYDAENLTLLKAENGDIFKNSEYSSDLRNDGSCKFTWLSSTENKNDGTLLTLKFKVGEKGGNYSIDMSIEEAETSEEEMPFVTQDANIENVGDKAQLGDVNGDGNINFADAIVLLRFDIGFAELSDYQKSIADVNNDGDVDFADAIKILRFDAGLISSLK